MSRQYQNFAPRAGYEGTLEVADSPWFIDNVTTIPLEHWNALRDLAVGRQWVDRAGWEQFSSGEVTEEQLPSLYQGLMTLQSFLRHDMTGMLRRTAAFPEPLPGSEHARMLEGVIKIIESSGPELRGWVEEEE